MLLLAAYGRGGLARFRQESPAEFLGQVETLRDRGVRVGVAPHSVRACPADWLEEIGAYAAAEGSRSTCTPTSSRARSRSAWPSTACARSSCSRGPAASARRRPSSTRPTPTTHELDLLADAGARVCLCPTTEANLGDGYAPVEALLERGIPICIGSDSNVRIDPLEELRELEGIARRSTGRRNVVPVETLLSLRLGRGSRGARPRAVAGRLGADLGHRSLAGVDPADVPGALVFGCSADVFAVSAATQDSARAACGRERMKFRPVERAVEVRTLGGAAAQAVGAVVALEVALAALPPSRARAGSICVPSCHSL